MKFSSLKTFITLAKFRRHLKRLINRISIFDPSASISLCCLPKISMIFWSIDFSQYPSFKSKHRQSNHQSLMTVIENKNPEERVNIKSRPVNCSKYFFTATWHKPNNAIDFISTGLKTIKNSTNRVWISHFLCQHSLLSTRFVLIYKIISIPVQRVRLKCLIGQDQSKMKNQLEEHL